MSSVFAEGSESVFETSDLWMIGIGVVVVAILVVIGIVVRARKSQRPVTEQCEGCGSVNVQHRAGLVVCMDCGHSEHAAAA